MTPEPHPKLHALFDRTRHFRHAKHLQARELLLQERDWATLTILQSYRVLDTATLRKLVNNTQSEEHQVNELKFQRRLRMLWRAEYLERPREALYLKLIGQEKCLLWALGRKGYAALAPKLGLSLDNYQARRHKQLNEDIKAQTLAHNLGLNKFRACIELATTNHPTVKLLSWSHQNLKAMITPPQHQLTLFKVPEKTLALIPDGLLALEHITEPPPNRSFHFIEYDNSTTPLTRWTYKKGLGYAEYHRQDLQSKLRGLKTFNILIIAPTPTRKDNLREAIANWLAHAKHKGTTYPDLWLFADKTMYDLEQPQSVLGTIWQAATSDEKRSLLD